MWLTPPSIGPSPAWPPWVLSKNTLPASKSSPCYLLVAGFEPSAFPCRVCSAHRCLGSPCGEFSELHQHGWRLWRNYQRRRKHSTECGNCMNQSIPMRVGCWWLAVTPASVASIRNCFPNSKLHQHGWGLCVVTGLSFLPTPTLVAEINPHAC